MTLQKFIEEMPHGRYQEFRSLVKLEMLKAGFDISDQTFRNWERGIYEPGQEKKEVLNRCALQITGETIY